MGYWFPCIDSLSLTAAQCAADRRHQYVYEQFILWNHILSVHDPNEHMSYLYRFLFSFSQWSSSFFMLNISTNSVPNAGWIFYRLFTQRNKDTRQTHVEEPHKYMQKCFFNGCTSKCIKIPFSIIWKCIFLNYSSRGIEAPRSFKFFISAQLQTVDLVKGTQFLGCGNCCRAKLTGFFSLEAPLAFSLQQSKGTNPGQLK